MKNGNWIPISKGFLKHLPKDRPFSKLEAAFSLQLDYDAKKAVTITGYANLWRWSVGKVYRFLREMNIQIEYPEDTKKRQNQNGMIMNMITERSGKKNGMIRLIENKDLQVKTERCDKKNGMKTEGSQTTTIYPNTNTTTNTCPQQAVVDLYHAVLPGLAKVKVWSAARQAALRARWNEAVPNNNGLKSNSLAWWGGFFKYISKSDFLMGRVDRKNGKPFKANLEWIVQKKNFVNILEGKYH